MNPVKSVFILKPSEQIGPFTYLSPNAALRWRVPSSCTHSSTPPPVVHVGRETWHEGFNHRVPAVGPGRAKLSGCVFCKNTYKSMEIIVLRFSLKMIS